VKPDPDMILFYILFPILFWGLLLWWVYP